MIYLIAIILLNLMLYLPVLLGIGFLSDDFGFVLSEGSIWLPMEKHHYSPLIHALFRFQSPLLIHSAALTVHIANSLLLFNFAKQLPIPASNKEDERGTLGTNAAGILALIFATSPAGYEAIAWCCAIGYVLTVFWLLLALQLFWRRPGSSLLLGLIQLLALLSWDWGIIITPILAASALIDPQLRKRWKELLLAATVWIGVFLAKKLLNQDAGYEWNGIAEVIKIYGVAPLMAFFPQGSKEFYTSGWGIALNIGLWIAIGALCRRSIVTRLFAAMAVICMGPMALLSYPQSRYFYIISLPMMLIALECLVTYLRNKQLQAALLTAALLATLSWNQHRQELWINASIVANKIYQQIVALSKEEPIIVLDLPDRWGPDHTIWLPYIWRNGRAILPGATFYRSETPLHPYPIEATVYQAQENGMNVQTFRVDRQGNLGREKEK